MKKFVKVISKAVPWLMPNVDTDIITPMKRILSSPTKLEQYAFEPYRFIGGNADTGSLDPAFPLNKPEYKDVRIMIVGENFGSGSSRETAPAAIAKLGISVLIGSSFGGIFFKNCFKVGLLAISLDKEKVEKLAALAEAGSSFTVDLAGQSITAPDGIKFPFEIEPLRKTALLEGLDDVDMTLKQKSAINAWRQKDKTIRPWIYTL